MRFLIFFLFLSYFSCCNENIEIIETNKIWDKAKHNAFTTLIQYNDELYCAFREASSHHSYDGIIRIIKSIDGVKWESVTSLNVDNQDLRDPKFFINSNKSLVLIGVARDQSKKHYSYSWISEDGVKWSVHKEDLNYKNTWRWGGISYDKNIYSIGYSGDDISGRLYKSENGRDWMPIKDDFFPNKDSYFNETALFFTSKEKLIAIVRKDKGNKNALIGISKKPYKLWEWKELGQRIASPSGILINDNYILLVGRLYDNKIRTSVGIIDINNGTFKELAKLPSGGDTGYAGIIKFNNEYYISYNSSHKNKKNFNLSI